MHQEIITRFNSLKEKQLSIDITRGKPNKDQLDLSNELLSAPVETKASDGPDIRNYGEPWGISEARELGAALLDSPVKSTIAAEQSSLLLSYQLLLASYLYGINGTAWKDIENPKFICPTPGFDRHFRMLDELGIEMLSVPLMGDGVDVDSLEKLLAQNSDIVGFICVPRHSNPSGDVYSDENLLNIFKICSEYSNDLIFLFDHAYLIHDFPSAPIQTPIWSLAKDSNVLNQTAILTSFSKVTFGGGGLSFFAGGEGTLSLLKKIRTSMIICPDKVNQLRHVNFLKNKDNISRHMAKHAQIIQPKFELTQSILKAIPEECGTYSTPSGGYFITYRTAKPIATRVIELCKEAGILITPAGATYPYGLDPKDSVIRLAPTFVSATELEEAMNIFSLSVQIAHFNIDI